jgi:hypothetical protein
MKRVSVFGVALACVLALAGGARAQFTISYPTRGEQVDGEIGLDGNEGLLVGGNIGAGSLVTSVLVGITDYDTGELLGTATTTPNAAGTWVVWVDVPVTGGATHVLCTAVGTVGASKIPAATASVPFYYGNGVVRAVGDRPQCDKDRERNLFRFYQCWQAMIILGCH